MKGVGLSYSTPSAAAISSMLWNTANPWIGVGRRRRAVPEVAAADEAPDRPCRRSSPPRSPPRCPRSPGSGPGRRRRICAARRNRSGAGLPCATIEAQKTRPSKSGDSPVTSSDSVARSMRAARRHAIASAEAFDKRAHARHGDEVAPIGARTGARGNPPRSRRPMRGRSAARNRFARHAWRGRDRSCAHARGRSRGRARQASRISVRVLMTSLSTSTPSQSKMTRSKLAFGTEFLAGRSERITAAPAFRRRAARQESLVMRI